MNKILQIDREAAADGCLRRLEQSHEGWQLWMSEAVQPIREGQQDDHYDVKAFASHREQATRKLVEALQGFMNDLERRKSMYGEAAIGPSGDVIYAARLALTKANPDA